MQIQIQQLDSPIRMFLCCLCVSDDDLEALGVMPKGCECCLSRGTLGRSMLHRLIVDDDVLARTAADRLDLRHVDEVTHVRSLSVEEVARESRVRGRTGRNAALAGWAWAVATDEREEVARLVQNLMGECYVRGLRGLTES